MRVRAKSAGSTSEPPVTSSEHLLELAAAVTGMGCVVAARLVDGKWVAFDAIDHAGAAHDLVAPLEACEAFCQQALAADAPVQFSDAGGDPAGRDSASLRRHGYHSLIAVPLHARDGVAYGALCALDRAPHAPAAPLVEAMRRLAHLYGAGLDEASDLRSSNAARARSEHQLAQSKQHLIDSHAVAKLREEFIAVLAHDLRSPLQCIRMVVDLLATASLTPSQQRNVGRLHDSVERMAELIAVTMDFARGRLGGGLALEIVACSDLGIRLQRVVDEIWRGYPDRVVLAVFELPGSVRCDPNRLGQLLSNLMVNAVVHGTPDTPIRIRGEAVDDELRLSVANLGVIPSDRIERIFEPFDRQQEQRLDPGLGLGLYIASQIAIAHGGTLKVLSAEPDGTLFSFAMPLRAAGDARAQSRSSAT